MFRAVKKQMAVLWRDWMWSLALLSGGSLIGFAMLQLILRSDPDMKSYLALGTIMGGVIAAIFTCAMEMTSLGIYFNIEVSMGYDRKNFFVSYLLVSLAQWLSGAGILILICMAESAANQAMYPDMGNEIDLLPYLLKWSLPAAFFLMALSLFCGVLMIRCGKKTYWILWGIWMIAGIGGPRILDAVTETPDSVFGRIGKALGTAITAVPGNAWVPCAFAAGVLGLAVSYGLLHRQQVNS